MAVLLLLLREPLLRVAVVTTLGIHWQQCHAAQPTHAT